MGNDFNDAISAAVRAEHRARGWSVEQLAGRLPEGSDLSVRTLYKLLSTKPPTGRNKPEWKASYIAAAAEALGMAISDLTAAAEARQAQMSGAPTSAEGRPSFGASPRTLISWLLAHPEDDEELNTRLSEAASQTGLSGRRLAALQETMREVRQEELTRALDALPPSTVARADQQQSG